MKYNQSTFNYLLGDNPMVCLQEVKKKNMNKKIKYDYFVLDKNESVIKSFTTVESVAYYLGYTSYEIRKLISVVGVHKEVLKIHIVANINQNDVPVILLRKKRSDG